jgi:hypothetical protein
VAGNITQKLSVDFKSFNGWIIKLERQFVIVYIAVTGESSSVNQDKVVAVKDIVLQHLMPKYMLKDIFHASECGLFYNMLPDKNYTFKGESGGGMKVYKERISVVCVNMDCFESCQPLL